MLGLFLVYIAGSMGKGDKLDFSKEPEQKLFGSSKDDANWRRWKAYLKDRNIVNPLMSDLAAFMDYYVQAKSPSMMTVLSSVHSRAVTEEDLFRGQQKAYSLLFSRVKARYSSLGLDRHKAVPIEPQDLLDLSLDDRAVAVFLISTGRRVDNVVDPVKGALVSKAAEGLSVSYRKDKRDRLGSVVVGCACSSSFANNFCCAHGFSRRLLRMAPFSWGDADRVLRNLNKGNKGFSYHSFRRTLAIMVRKSKPVLSEGELKAVNVFFGWSDGSKEFFAYSDDFERWSFPSGIFVHSGIFNPV